MHDAVTDWLLRSDPWTAYNTRIHLLGQSMEDTEVRKARHDMLTHPQIVTMIDSFANWDTEVVSNHKNAGLLIHKLAFLADIGLSTEDDALAPIIETVLQRTDEYGMIRVPVNIPTHFGGSGKTEWGWALCDTPSILYALAKFGLAEHPSIKAPASYLASLIGENGWRCTVSPELGKFRGPGKKDDPCPYATLLSTKALAQLSAWHDSAPTRIGAECLLRLWEHSREQHPYLFYMGTDFRKLKAPSLWYDIVHVAKVLSQFAWLKDDPRRNEMIAHLLDQADDAGRFTPQSEWKAWRGWEFAQKKMPSAWLTYTILRIAKQAQVSQ